MDLKTAAALLNGREYREELSADDIKMFREEGLVALYGASDDLAYLNGKIGDEVGATTIYLTRQGVIPADEIDWYDKFKKEYVTIGVHWCEDEDGFCWSYSTDDIQYEVFEIFEEGEPYSRGIIFKWEDLPEGV